MLKVSVRDPQWAKKRVLTENFSRVEDESEIESARNKVSDVSSRKD